MSQNQNSSSAVAQPSSTRRAAPSAKIFAIGGVALISVEIFDTETNVWTKAANVDVADDGGAAILDGAVCVNTEVFLKCFNASANVWKAQGMLLRNKDYAFVSFNKSIYAFGGRGRGEGRQRGVERIDPTTGLSTRRADMSTGRHSFGACGLGDRIYVVGGRVADDFDERNVLSSVEKYDPLRDRWSTVRSMNTRRSGHSVVCTGGKVYAIGDRRSWGNSRTAEAYDPRANRWHMIAPMSQRRRRAGAVGFDGHIYVIGGEEYREEFNLRELDSMEVYDIESDTWTVSPHRMAHARSGPAVAVLRVGATDEDVQVDVQQVLGLRSAKNR